MGLSTQGVLDWTIKYFRGDLAPYSQTVGSLFWKDIFVDESAMYIGCIPDKKMFNPPKVLLDCAIAYLGGDQGPYGQTVRSIFRKVLCVDESSMYIGCIPEKLGLSTQGVFRLDNNIL
jgi:hypothetical protein